MARAVKNIQSKTLESSLWRTADSLRGNQELSEHKHVVLDLVFLKYISNCFEVRRAAIRASHFNTSSIVYISREKRLTNFFEYLHECTSRQVLLLRNKALESLSLIKKSRHATAWLIFIHDSLVAQLLINDIRAPKTQETLA